MTVRRIQLNVNGNAQQIEADDKTPLLYILRHDLGLKGTKFGCGAGQCGSCHVLMDGVSVPACDTPVWAAEGKTLVTVEGLAQGAELDPLQQSFIDEQAAQCGYCLPGILVTATAFLRSNPDPTENDVKGALDLHLCRCGSHQRIVRAVLRAAKVMALAA